MLKVPNLGSESFIPFSHVCLKAVNSFKTHLTRMVIYGILWDSKSLQNTKSFASCSEFTQNWRFPLIWGLQIKPNLLKIRKLKSKTSKFVCVIILTSALNWIMRLCFLISINGTARMFQIRTQIKLWIQWIFAKSFKRICQRFSGREIHRRKAELLLEFLCRIPIRIDLRQAFYDRSSILLFNLSCHVDPDGTV